MSAASASWLLVGRISAFQIMISELRYTLLLVKATTI